MHLQKRRHSSLSNLHKMTIKLVTVTMWQASRKHLHYVLMNTSSVCVCEPKEHWHFRGMHCITKQQQQQNCPKQSWTKCQKEEKIRYIFSRRVSMLKFMGTLRTLHRLRVHFNAILCYVQILSLDGHSNRNIRNLHASEVEFIFMIIFQALESYL